MTLETQSWSDYKNSVKPPHLTLPSFTGDEKLMFDTRMAMAEALGDWINPDSPEAFSLSMQKMQAMCGMIDERLNL